VFVAATSVTARLAVPVVQVQAQAVASLQGLVLLALCVQMLPCVVLLVELEGQLEAVVLLVLLWEQVLVQGGLLEGHDLLYLPHMYLRNWYHRPRLCCKGKVGISSLGNCR
jgi:hypothetical protein